MKNNFFSSKKPKIGFIALLLFFCGLFSQTAVGQTAYVWNGITSNDWATSTNWTPNGVPGGNSGDTVTINTGVGPTISSGSYTINRITSLANSVGTPGGSTLTIANGATLSVSTSLTPVITLAGGNIINNGTLNVTSTTTAASSGITCATPASPPASGTNNYGYSGTGALTVDVSASNTANSAGFSNTSVNTFTFYNLMFNGTATFNLSSTLNTAVPQIYTASYAIRATGGTGASMLTIGGTGFSIAGINGGLISMGSQARVTVDTGTTLTMNSAATNFTRGIASFSGSTTVTTFTNKGTINMLGSSTVGGIFYSTGAAVVVPWTFTNEGTININLNSSGVQSAPLSNGNGGFTGSGGTLVTFTNASTGTLTLKNTSTVNGTGSAIFGSPDGAAPPITITNNGTMTLDGTTYNYGSKTSIINNGTINSNNEFRSFNAVTNNTGAIINFAKTAATATTRAVNFNGVPTSTTSGGVGATYQDANGNVYVVMVQKFSSGTGLIANVISTADVTPSGTLTRLTGSGVGTMSYTSVSIAELNSALVASTSTNLLTGTINTGSASDLSILSGVSNGSTGVIAPGGAGYGVANLGNVGALTPAGTMRIQVNGSAIGTDSDQLGVFNGGSGYTSAPTISFNGGGGSGAVATVVLTNTTVASIAVNTAGSLYTSVPTVALAGGGFTTAATATAILSGGTTGSVTGFTISGVGNVGYKSVPTVTLSGGGATTQTTAIATLTPTSIASITVSTAGTGYINVPTVSISGGGGTSATATATLSGVTVGTIAVNNAGSGYTSLPLASVISTEVKPTATATITNGVVTGLTINTVGSGYSSAPTVIFSGGGVGSGANATATVASGAVTGFSNTTLSLTNLKLNITSLYTPSGYVAIPIVAVSGFGTTITNTFGGPNITGMASGWGLVYTDNTKVQLVYGTAWTGGTSTTWTDAANWSNGVPGATTDVVIGTGTTHQPVIAADATVKSLTLNATTPTTLTINSGTLTVTTAIVNNGSLTIANNASLVQTTGSTYSGSGNTTVTRNSNALKRLDYTMWSSPVSGTTKTFEQFSPNTSRIPNRFYTYDAANNYYINVTTTNTFAPGLGYLIRMPNEDATPNYNTGATLAFPGVFTGTSLNNGTINLGTLVAEKFYSVGNPYPSPISASSFIAGTSGLGATLYFWRKTNNTANGTTPSGNGTAYATWTSVGGTSSGNVVPNTIAPNEQIAVGQGFIVNTGSATTINFTNSMRTSTAANFLKTKAVATPDRIWLNLTNATGAFSQTLIGYTANATLGVDRGIDGEYINDSPTALTSIVEGGEYTIQGRPAFDATDVVALGFKTDVAGDYTIALNSFDGLFASGQDVYLVDAVTGNETDLKTGSYSFTTTGGVNNARFSLKYQKTLKVIDAALDNNSVSVYQNNGSIYINSKSAAIRSVKVFDVQGRLIAEQRNVKSNTAVFSNLRVKNQLLIVNVVGEDNSEVSKKVMN